MVNGSKDILQNGQITHPILLRFSGVTTAHLTLTAPLSPSSSCSFINHEFRIYEFLIFIMISFPTDQLKKKLLWTNKKVVFFFKFAQTEKNFWKKLVKQIGENI
jgi:hypothetical protein